MSAYIKDYSKYKPLWLGISSEIAQWMVVLAPLALVLPNIANTGFKMPIKRVEPNDWPSRLRIISVYTTPKKHGYMLKYLLKIHFNIIPIPGCNETVLTPVPDQINS